MRETPSYMPKAWSVAINLSFFDLVMQYSLIDMIALIEKTPNLDWNKIMRIVM